MKKEKSSLLSDISVKSRLCAIVTSKSRLPDLPIKNGQLIFIRDCHTIAFDISGERTFYNQIVTLEKDNDRLSLSPINDTYYFVTETMILWIYHNQWIPITGPPQDILFIGDELPIKGKENTLYINKTQRNIAVWDDNTSTFITVGDHYSPITDDDIKNLF